jgi:hypothetical protein
MAPVSTLCVNCARTHAQPNKSVQPAGRQIAACPHAAAGPSG